MIGDDSDSGSEEEIEAEVVAPVQNLTPKATKTTPSFPATQTTQTVNEKQWTRHRSTRYKDSRYPHGYEYLFCNETGESKWVDEGIESHSSLKRSRDESTTTTIENNNKLNKFSSIQMNHIINISDGYITYQNEKVKYFCDQRKKWGFDTDHTGFELLGHMVTLNQPALKACHERIQTIGDEKKVLSFI